MVYLILSLMVVFLAVFLMGVKTPKLLGLGRRSVCLAKWRRRDALDGVAVRGWRTKDG